MGLTSGVAGGPSTLLVLPQRVIVPLVMNPATIHPWMNWRASGRCRLALMGSPS